MVHLMSFIIRPQRLDGGFKIHVKVACVEPIFQDLAHGE